MLKAFDRFLFASCDPRVCSWIRIMMAIILLIYTGCAAAYATVWLTDSGVLTSGTAKSLGGSGWSVLFLLPSTSATVHICLSLLAVHSLLMLLGYRSQLQAAFIFVWLNSLQHRNPLILDGEDTVLRLMLFFMIFMPLDYMLAVRRRPLGRDRRSDFASAWALRLVQLEISAIYLSTAWCKWQGDSWREGTALYYVSRMDDVFGRFWLPDYLFETMWILQLTTWSVLAVETILPFALWIRPLRPYAILLAIALHLSIEYAMHLFLFEWIMIVGVLSFAGSLKRMPIAATTSTTANTADPAGEVAAQFGPPQAIGNSPSC